MSTTKKITNIVFGALALAACEPVDEAQVATGEEGARTTSSSSIYVTPWNGQAAHAEGWDGYGGMWLDVWENASRGTRQAFLSFNRQGVDPNSVVCQTYEYYCWYSRDVMTSTTGDPMDPLPEPELCSYEYCYYSRYYYDYAYGEIPANRFEADGRRASLNLALSDAPNLWVVRCTYDTSTGTFECSSGAPDGRIDLDWRKNGGWSSSSSGSQTYSYGGYNYRNSGTHSASSADVDGAMFGSSVSVGYGAISKGVSATKDMFRAQ
jgi:hypothetical protein